MVLGANSFEKVTHFKRERLKEKKWKHILWRNDVGFSYQFEEGFTNKAPIIIQMILLEIETIP